MIVRVPASSANLGPGFDTLGMALSLHAEVGVIDGDVPPGAQRIDQFHPAGIAFRRAGGEGDCGCARRSRSAAASASAAPCASPASSPLTPSATAAIPDRLSARRTACSRSPAELEGHADNVAASLFGGVVATADGRAVRVPLAFDPAIVVWVPSFTTSTDESRPKLGTRRAARRRRVQHRRIALLVAALLPATSTRCAARRRTACTRIVVSPTSQPSKAALQLALEAGAWCAWLSGSGPTGGGDVRRSTTPTSIAAHMPADGHTKVLRIDHDGAVIEADD